MARTRLALVALMLCAAAATAAEEPPADPAPRRIELYFEAKLLVRDRVLFQRVAIDQWVGGRLTMEARSLGPGTVFELVRPVEDPWTFRWYPTRDEVKLGAAIAVAEPRGDPYGSLAEALTADALQRYDEWWDDDRVVATTDRQPTWQDRAERFWAARHAVEQREKDPLPEHPVFPFHVLGDPRGRVGFAVGPDGGVLADSIVERMSEPWLADGWRDWQRGERRAGYGYWEAERPGWEPHTYQALAVALELLAWSPWPEETGEPGRPVPSRTVAGLPRRLARFLETLNPRVEGRLDWDGPLTLRTLAEAGAVETHGEVASLPGEPKLGFRVWRYARRAADGRPVHDEVQVLAEHRAGAVKAWLKVGYRAAPER